MIVDLEEGHILLLKLLAQDRIYRTGSLTVKRFYDDVIDRLDKATPLTNDDPPSVQDDARSEAANI